MNLKIKWHILWLLFLAACFPKEEAILPKPRENKSVSIDVGELKNNITFYSLEKGEMLAQTSPEAWDVYADAEGFKLNFLRSTRVAIFTEEWASRVDTVGLRFNYLTTDGNASQWMLEENTNYVFDLGLDNSSVHLGFMKIYVAKENYKFTIKYSLLNEKSIATKEFYTSYFYYSLISDKIVELPEESKYDVVFGKYTDFVKFADEEADYLVYGALLGNALAYKLEKPFEEVSLEDFKIAAFDVSKRTTIGWDWKSYSLEKGAYEINSNYTYLIQTKNGFKYKFRFVNFYNTKGISGHPTFEYKLI